MTAGDAWDPARYGAFAAERRQPFDDLVARCEPVAGGAVVDLGCGPGALTVELHAAMRAGRTIGVDNSAAMLERARALDLPDGVSFVEADLETWDPPAPDLVFANASLQWVDDHPTLLERLRASLAEGGQLAFQVPANFGHVSHRLARELAREEPFLSALGGDPPPSRGDQVLTPAEYAELFYDLGATEQRVQLTVYSHLLGSSAEVVDWVQGTMLTAYRARLDDATYEAFVDRYRTELVRRLGDARPYFYTYPRILAWARFGSAGASRP
jgi:trans-aconitate 2-methyltransferase